MTTEVVKDWPRQLVSHAKEFALPILCSYVEGENECGFDAVFSFLLDDGEHIEVCALHFSPVWMRGLFEHYGSVHDMAVLQEFGT